MKIIISHDVDHLYWHDHLFDTWWPGLWYRSAGEVLSCKLKLSTARKRLLPGKNLHNIPSISNFLIDYKIPSTFFFGMRKGLNLSYYYKSAGPFIEQLIQNDFLICLHGIAFNDRNLMLEEKDKFSSLTGFEPLGIRTHYLRTDNSTYELISALGYKFDSSENKIDFPEKHNDSTWAIPISVMDVDVIHGSDESSLTGAINKTLFRIEQAKEKGIPYFVVNFHDYYFSESYPVFIAYFKWIIKYFINHKYEFISFKQAVSELNS